MNRKVLDRPMFALMRDGSIKPVQYHWIGAAIGLGARAAPLIGRGASYMGKGLGYLKPWQWGKGAKESGAQIIKSGKYAGQKFKDIYPHLWKKGNMPKFNITSTSIPNIALQTGATALPFVPGVYESITGEEEITEGKPDDKWKDEQKKRDREDEQRGVPKDDKKDVKNFEDMLSSGDLDNMIKDRISIFEEYLGKDVDKRKKSAGYNAMIEFGLNLASARGGNLVDKISRSAKDPMARFASVGEKILDRAEKIKMAGVESGISAQEKKLDRDVDKEALANELKVQEMKNAATKMDRQEFMLKYSGELLTNEDALRELMKPYMTIDPKTKQPILPEGMRPQDIIKGVLEGIWESSKPKVITEELIVMAQNTEGNESLSREEIIKGFVDNGYELPAGG